MPNYDFQSLSSYDFELLARDLLQKDLNVRLESFGKGRDGGIDFRFRNPQNDLIVQCKHYADYDLLYRILKRSEAGKVQRLKPLRYILVVSTSLTPQRKEDILALFKPYCRSTDDVIGREDLNNLLGLHPDIERSHFKLWLTSESVMARFLGHGVWGDSELTIERIRQRTRLYVPNPSFARARKVLDKYHYCIIAGIPGIGKTTLAEILLIDHVDRREFQAVRIANDLAEIKAIKNPHSRQIFYFDDFLGKTALDKLQKNEDQRLIEFMEEVASNNNWRFVLTTREYILNAARFRYETLANSAVDLAPCIVDLADYTRPIRARILYNHIFFSDLPDSYKRALLENRRYDKIVVHPNYNPRIIDHMTRARNVVDIPIAAYFDDFLKNLANPILVWDHAFRHQLSEAAQHVLLVMGSLSEEVLLNDLEIGFNKFYQHRRKQLGFSTTSRDFERALKELDGNFIKTTLVGKDQVILLHNPSVRDFLESYLANSPKEVLDLLESASFFDQFTRLWRGLRGKRFSAIDNNALAFLEPFAQNFTAPQSELVRVRNSMAEAVGVRRVEWSFEAKTIFALEVALALDTTSARAVLERSLEKISERITAGDADKMDLVSLLQKITPIKESFPASAPLLSNTKNYLIGSLEDFEDYKSFGRLVKSFPSSVEPSTKDRIGVEFIEYCKDYVDGWDDDPELLRHIANEISMVASQLGADVDEYSDKLIDLARELEAEQRRSEDDSDDSDERWLNQDRASEDVDLMFEDLLNEIDEKSN